MKVRYDPSVDAAYISLLEEGARADFGHTVACAPQDVGGQIHMDFDTEGRLIGIEVLQASKKLPLKLLEK